jgi:hypothetical protein
LRRLQWLGMSLILNVLLRRLGSWQYGLLDERSMLLALGLGLGLASSFGLPSLGRLHFDGRRLNLPWESATKGVCFNPRRQRWHRLRRLACLLWTQAHLRLLLLLLLRRRHMPSICVTPIDRPTMLRLGRHRVLLGQRLAILPVVPHKVGQPVCVARRPVVRLALAVVLIKSSKL